MVETDFEAGYIFPVEIKSERLYYTPLHKSEISEKRLFELNSTISSKDTQYVTFSPYENILEAKEFIERSESNFEKGESATYAIFTQDNDDFIGTAGLEINWNRKIAESGVFLYPEYWGHGYGTERGHTFVEVAFKEYTIDTWLSRVHTENIASQKSIEKYVVGSGGEKCGLIPNYNFDGKLADIYLYSLRRREYNCE